MVVYLVFLAERIRCILSSIRNPFVSLSLVGVPVHTVFTVLTVKQSQQRRGSTDLALTVSSTILAPS